MRIALGSAITALAGLCLILGCCVLYECVAPLAPFDTPEVELKKPVAATATALFTPPSMVSFAILDARPLFNPTRQPFDTSQTPGSDSAFGSAVPPLPNDVSLVGVIIDGDRQLALVKTQSAPFAESLRVGALIGGWKVTEIAPDKVVLHAGGAEQILRIGDQRSGQTQANRPPLPNVRAVPSMPSAGVMPFGPPTTLRPPIRPLQPTTGPAPTVGGGSP